MSSHRVATPRASGRATARAAARAGALTAALALTLAPAACRSPRKGGAADAAPAQSPAATPPGGSNPSLGMLGALMASNAGKPGPYEEPRSSANYHKDADHSVIVDLDGRVVELRAPSLFKPGGIELRALTDKLDDLAGDKLVKSLVIRLGDDFHIDLTSAEEVRAAFDRFRGSPPGRRTIACYAESPSNVTYYLLSACDSLGLAPGGEVMVSGVAAMPIHLKGLLDHLGIQADFIHIGAFKGAAEPLTRARPSPEMMETLGAILDHRYQTLVGGIAQGRHLDPTAVRGLIDTAVFPADAALAAHLVDSIETFDAFRDKATHKAEWTTLTLGDDKPDMAQLMQLLGMQQPSRPTAPHVALVYALGNVVDGKGQGASGARTEIAPRTLGAALRTLAADDSVKAVVLRIDSGGGSALASEILWQAIAQVRAKKPVLASMGGVAASGGYYIACGATEIFADPDTLTGSIGVVGGKLVIGRALGKIGVAGFPMGRGKRALMFSSLSPWTPDEEAAVRASMESVYKTFVARVAKGRGKTPDQIQAIAQGRVWTGKAALDRGLVDTLGSLDDALRAARTVAKVGADAPLEVYPPSPSLLDMLSSIGSGLPFGLDAGNFGHLFAALAPSEAHALLAILTQLAGFQHSAVQAALLLPVVFN